MSFVLSLPHREGTGISKQLPAFNETGMAFNGHCCVGNLILKITGLDLLAKLLAFDPYERISSSDALATPYLMSYHDPVDEPVADHMFDFTFNTRRFSHGTWKARM